MDNLGAVLSYISRSWHMWESAKKGSRRSWQSDDDMVECTSLSNKIVGNVGVSQNKEI